MKKLLLVIAMVALGFTASAQTFGVKAGLNFSNVELNADGGSISPDSQTSFYLGGVVDFKISEKFHIQPEVLFSAEGFENFDMNFINVPVMAKYYITENFNLQAGPQVGFLVDAEDTEGLNSVNFGLGFGAAYEIEGGLFFDARYNMGISDLTDSGSDGVELTTNTFQVGLGYRF